MTKATVRVHTCSAVGCQHLVSVRMLMCIDHWRMVPVQMQREILASWRVRRARPRDAAAIERHEKARAAAIEAVLEKQDRKASERAGPSGELFT
jgi:hypothetical protein